MFSDRSYPSIGSMAYALTLEDSDSGIVFESFIALEKEKDILLPRSISSIRYSEKKKKIDNEMVYFQGKHSADKESTLKAYTKALEDLELSKSDFIEFVMQYAKDNYKTTEKDLKNAKQFEKDDSQDKESNENSSKKTKKT